mgnify:CR=1 FL=1
MLSILTRTAMKTKHQIIIAIGAAILVLLLVFWSVMAEL